jgi:lipopolysaccharide export system protein LptA
VRRRLLCLGLAAGLAAAAHGAAAEGIGVAPFEVVVPPGQAAPDLASHVAQRLATRGLGPVTGPREFGAPAGFEPAAADAWAWGARAGVDAIVVGRTTKLGSRLSVHARLLDGATGKPVGDPVVEEVAQPEGLGRAIDRLTGTLVERMASRPGAVSAAPAQKSSEPKARASVGFDRGKPLSIQSEQLEMSPEASGRHILFSGNVRAAQGELSLFADRLEAFYAPGVSEPERLVARGHVTIKQGARVARCAEAIFYRGEERIVCTGQLAELEQACDRVRGPKIVFHLGSERLEVEGGADVQLRPELPGCSGTAASGGPGR